MQKPALSPTRRQFLACAAAGTCFVLRAPLTRAHSAGLSDQEKEKFLLTADVVEMKTLSVGITGSRKAVLTDGKLTHEAHVQTIDEFKPVFQSARGTEINFRDSYKYNIAGYRLDRQIDLQMTPVSVYRKVGGYGASVTWWVEDVVMMEKDRYLKKIQPPDRRAWNDQMYQARVFNNLTYNTDPNLGNLLIDKNWRLWLVDFTRAFRIHKSLRDRRELEVVDQRVWNGLQRLTYDGLEAVMEDFLTRPELRAVLARRDNIVEELQKKIAGKGEGAVICRQPGH